MCAAGTGGQPKNKLFKIFYFLFCPNKNTFWTKNYLKMIFHRPVENRLVGWKFSIFFPLFSWAPHIQLNIVYHLHEYKNCPKASASQFWSHVTMQDVTRKSFSTASTATRFYAGLGCFTTNKRSLQPRIWDARWWRTSSQTKKHTKRMFGVNLKGAS